MTNEAIAGPEAERSVIADEAREPSPERPAPREDDAGKFSEKRFTSGVGTLNYKLFIPGALPRGTMPPLLLMLHGCTQTPDDFARGTRMNSLAQQHGYVVAYPAQAQGNNASKCWNWFRAQDQQRGRGEAALLAELAQHLVNAYEIDPRRVYAAGLSAGGAMAAVLANTYADVFSAIGVHSGLPFGVAHDLPTAFAAMKQGQRLGRKAPSGAQAVPAIVFHGDADATVDVSNGPAVIAQLAGHRELGDRVEASDVIVEKGAVSGGRSYTRTVVRDATGTVSGEQWTVHGAGHMVRWRPERLLYRSVGTRCIGRDDPVFHRVGQTEVELAPKRGSQSSSVDTVSLCGMAMRTLLRCEFHGCVLRKR